MSEVLKITILVQEAVKHERGLMKLFIRGLTSQYVCCLDPQTAEVGDSVAQHARERQSTRLVSDIALRTVPVGQKPQVLGMRKPSLPCTVTNARTLGNLPGSA